VLGAFQSAPQPDVKCRYCGTLNPADAKKCKTCGSALATPVAAPAAVAAPQTGGFGILPIIVIGVVIIACIGFALLSGRTTDTVGAVRSVAWQRSISVLEQRPVQHEDWKDKVPAGAKLGACRQEVRRTQDEPAPGAQKVCGTPYTVNEGNGVGKVVQDCRYNIPDDFCEYTSNEWLRVDAVVAQGSNNTPQWPNPALNATRRLGNRDESYTVILVAGDKTYTYNPRDAGEYARFTPGSKWTLKINGLGMVTSVTPA
jgi:ribosomal protein S27E